MSTSSLMPVLCVSPSRVIRGVGVLAEAGAAIAQFGQRPFLVAGDRTLALVRPQLEPSFKACGLSASAHSYSPDCSETTLIALKTGADRHHADVIVGIGGGKALDAAKLLGHQCNLPVVTIPTSAATCAAWTALSNVYSDQGAFLYDVPLPQCPQVLLLDYDLVRSAPQRTLVAGIGDAIAKWYEASVSSGHSQQTLIIAAVQQARVLRDILFQKSLEALQNPGSAIWQEVVDATVLLAGVIGGLGGAQCRTVAAHAVHNGLTHLPASHGTLHGEKVAYGILVQLRLEELLQGNQLAASARHQLLKFYREIGLPTTLHELGMAQISLADLHHAAELACAPESDIHHLPFAIEPSHLMAAMVSTTAPLPEKSSELAVLIPEATNAT
jgi:glycerol dehydrogenase-like iron-containing ADH family enzyme